MAQHGPRRRPCQPQTLGTQPRAPHHDVGLSAAHGGVRHARRLERVRRPLRVDAGEPHRICRHADLAPLVVGRGLHLCRQRGVVVLVPKRRHRQRRRCRRGLPCGGIQGERGGRRSMAVGVVHGRHRRRHLVPPGGHPHRRPGVLPQRLSISLQELRVFGRQRRHLAPRLRARRRGRHDHRT